MDITLATPLLGGLSPQTFMRLHWQKKPLLVRQAIPGGSAADRMKFFYLAWTLSMIGCALGSRIRPARLNALRTTGGSGFIEPPHRRPYLRL